MALKAKAKPDTISLQNNFTRLKEAKASEAISPGHIVELHLDSGELKVRKNEQGAGVRMLCVALEDDLHGKTINDAWASGDLVRYAIPGHGDVVRLRLPAGATAVTLGAAIGVNNASGQHGTVVLDTSSTGQIGIAREAIDNSSGSTEAFIAVEISNAIDTV